MRGRYWMLAAVIALVPSVPRLTGACLGRIPPGGWALDPVAGDTSPPELDVEAVVDRADDLFGCGCGHHCPVLSYVIITPTAIDDHTPPEDIGYRLTVVGGQVPASVGLESGTVVTVNNDGLLSFRFDDDISSFSFDLEVVAIDASGNESAPIVVQVDG